LEELLMEKGLVPEGLIEEVNRLYQNDIGPMNGAKVVARSWIDPQYKARLLQDGTPDVAFAMVELGMATGTVETARDLEEGLSYLARNRSLGPSAHRSAAPSR
jgi:nitrile hydratase